MRWNVPLGFFTARIGVLNGEWVGLRNPFLKRSKIIGCNPFRLETGRGYWDWLGKWCGFLRNSCMGGQSANEGVVVSHTMGLTLAGSEGRVGAGV